MDMDNRFPIGELQFSEDATLTDIEGWLEKIDVYADRLRATVEGLDEDDLSKTYREDSWTVRQLVHHIADSQVNMFQRLKMALTDDNPTVPNFIQDEWAETPDTEIPVESSIQVMEGLNTRIVALGRTLTEEQLKRTFTHEINGEVTVAKKVAKLAWHPEHHLAHIRLALE